MKSRSSSMIMPLLIALPPVMPLFLLNHYYCADWLNHLWPVGYIANYFKGHFALPVTLSTSDFAALPYHVFYGRWLYSLSGIVGALTSPEIGLRAVVIASHLFQVASVYLAFRCLKAPRGLSWMATALATWSIYPLTNLFHRGAVAEFVTIACLNAVACLFLVFVKAESRNRKAAAFLWIVLGLSWLLGNHPITTLYGSFFLAFIGLFFSSSRRDVFFLLLAGALAALINAPFLYALLKYSPQLHIAQAPKILFIDSVDTLLSRLFPIPFDKRSLLLGTKIDTPYLETQINLPLLALCLSFFFKAGRRGLAGVFLLLCALVVLFSVAPWAWALLPRQLQIIQFPYRLVAYANLMVLAALLSLFARNPLPPGKDLHFPVWMTYGALCLIIKLTHVGAVKASKLLTHVDEDATYVSFVNNTDPLKNYTSVTMLKELPPSAAAKAFEVDLPIEISKRRFGEIHPEAAPGRGWVITNIAVFPWNEIYLGPQGAAGRAKKTRLEQLASSDGRIAVLAASASQEISVKIRPDDAWSWLNGMANFAMLLLSAITIVFSVFLRSSKRPA